MGEPEIEQAVDHLIDLLVAKGLLTERDAAALRAEVYDDNLAEALESLGRAVAAGPRGS